MFQPKTEKIRGIAELLDDGKKVVLFATARRVASELNELRNNGLSIFDIQKIRDFIWWSRELRARKQKGLNELSP